LVLSDAGGDFGIGGQVAARSLTYGSGLCRESLAYASGWCETVELRHSGDDVALLLERQTGGPIDVEHGVALRAQLDALKAARQKARAPLPRSARLRLAIFAGRGEDDEARQVVGLGTEAIREPRAHRRPAGDRRPRVHERVSRVVVNRLRTERAD